MKKTRNDNTQPTPSFLENNKPFVWITLVGFVIYLWSLFFGFTYLDDNVLILDHMFFIKNLGNFFNAFTMEVFHVLHASAAYYRPLLTISFMLDAQLSGTSPFFYHVTNVLIHLVSANLLYLFLIRLKYPKQPSFILSMIFVIHPALVQAVAWVPGRNDSLLTMFVLASMIFFIDWVNEKKEKQLYFHLLFFFLSLFTKESSIFLPLVYAGTVILLGKKLFTWRYFSPVAGWSVIMGVWFLLRKIALENPIKYEMTEVVSTLINHSPATLLFLGKLIFPFNMSVLPTLQDSTLIYGGIVLLLLILLVILSKNKRWIYILFGLSWFLGFLYPSYIRPDSTYVADFISHRMYLPIVGIFLIILETGWLNRVELERKAHKFIFISVAAYFTLFTFVHLRDFTDRISFWINAVETSPSHPLAHKNLGAMLYLDGRPDEAEGYYLTSLELNPRETMVHNNLGLIYMQRGDYKKAEEEFRKELEINPFYDNAHFNWGLLYLQLEDYDKALEMWKKTLEINPDHLSAHQNLYILYTQAGDKLNAQIHYEELIKRGVRLPTNIK